MLRTLGVDQHGARLHRHFLAAQRLDDHDAQPGQRDDDDEQDGDRRGDAGRPADLQPGDFGQARPSAGPMRPSTSMSCTAPARHTPTTSQISPGR